MASKAKSFWADLYTTEGIDQENIIWENVHHWECAPSDDTCAYRHWDYNFPVADGYDKEDVLNPKDVLSDAHKNVTFLSSEMTRAPDLMTKGTFSLDADDLAKEIGEEIEEAKREAILMAFLTAIFFFIPVIGEGAGAVSSMAAIGRIVALLGEVGNVALSIYTIVDDPDNAPLGLALFSPHSLLQMQWPSAELPVPCGRCI